MKKRFLSVHETTKVYSIGRTTLYGLISRGEIRALKAGGRTLVDVESVDAWADRLPRITSEREEAADAAS